MKVSVIQIGNSRGVRLPKAVLAQVGMGEAAELRVQGDSIVLTPIRPPRSGWEKAFAAEASGLSEEDRDWLDAPLTTEDPA